MWFWCQPKFLWSWLWDFGLGLDKNIWDSFYPLDPKIWEKRIGKYIYLPPRMRNLALLLISFQTSFLLTKLRASLSCFLEFLYQYSWDILRLTLALQWHYITPLILLQVHQKQRMACPVCGKRYSDLRQHIRLVHEGHKVTCKGVFMQYSSTVQS